MRYRVRSDAPGATVRRHPWSNAPIVRRLHPREDWEGTEVQGQITWIKGFGSSSVWIEGDRGFVWSGHLEEDHDSAA